MTSNPLIASRSIPSHHITGWLIVMTVTWLTMMVGCASQEMPLAKLDASDQRMVEGYSLLYDLVSKQQDLADIFILKSASDPTEAIIKDIASVSTQAAKRLEQWAQSNPTYGIRQPNLPAVEVDARVKIEEKTTVSLLTSGHDFELRLLLTQVDATNYGEALATVLAESDSNPERAAFGRQLAEQFKEFNTRVRQRLAVHNVTEAE